ncbi:MAG: hypothetical protein KDE14_02560 [Rhodobacteraceae bacterium]|nr:hypothetical protein [Paracoccaceae bacterium]
MAAVILLAAAGAKTSAETNLAVGMAAFPENWANPYGSTSITRLPLLSAAFDPLTLVTVDGELLPWLATSWTQAEPTVWRITLRPGVVYGDGTPFDATAVVAGFTYLNSGTGQREPVGRELTGVAGVRALDPMTVEIVTREPDPLIPWRMSLIYPPEPKAWARLGPQAFARAPVGTGPYKFDEGAPNRVRLVRADSSWRGAPTDSVEFLAIPEPSARQAALSTGRVDLAPTSVTPDQFDAVIAEGGQVVVDRIPAVVALAFNTETDARFKDVRVRRALTMAVNRAAIVAAMMGGKTRVAAQPAPHGTLGFDESLEPLPYDPYAARALLSKAGYKNDFAFDMEVPAGAVSYPDVFQQVGSDLARIGVTMTIRTIPQSKLLENIQTGGWNGSAAAIPFFTPIADALYPMRQHSCLWHAPWYCDKTATAEIEAAFAATDLDSRRAMTTAVMKRAHDEAQALYLYETVAFMGVGPRVKTVPVDFAFIRYEGLELAK